MKVKDKDLIQNKKNNQKVLYIIFVIIIIWLLCLTFNHRRITNVVSSDVGIRMNNGTVQWKYQDGSWKDLASTVDLTGNDPVQPKEIQIRKTDTNIEWSYTNEDNWKVIIPIAELKGDHGKQGDSFTFDDFTPKQLLQLKGQKEKQVNKAKREIKVNKAFKV